MANPVPGPAPAPPDAPRDAPPDASRDAPRGAATEAAPDAAPGPAAEAPPDALSGALRQILAPLARLAVARGVPHGTLDGWLKQALVDAADRSHAGLPPHRRVSRITTATGIHRREVSRLIAVLRDGSAQQAPAARSHASELFTHWRTSPAFCDRRGSPAELPRQGPAPSFEALAQAITRDVHPRSLLDELQRLGLAAHDPARDTVRLVREAFVPQGDAGRLAAVLGRNVGSHFDSAVDNLLLGERSHLEQAVFADGLSDQSLAEFEQLARGQWQALLDALVPALEAMVARDAAHAGADPAADPSTDPATDPPIDPPTDPATHPAAAVPATPTRHRVRIGLYTHAAAENKP